MRKTALCALLFLALLFSLPKIASGEWAKKQLISQLEKRLGGDISVEKISLSWTGEQRCINLKWVEPQNNITLSADEVIISDHLLNCMQFKQKPLIVTVLGTQMAFQPKGMLLKKKKYQNLELSCSPIGAVIENRTILFEKIDIDVTDSLKVSTWGSIDLGKQHMDITLGFPPKALEKLFGLKDLPEDFLLEIPVSCKMNSKSLEKKLLGFFLKNYANVTSLQR